MPNPGGASSGYLLRWDDAPVVVDLGGGVAGRIVEHVRLQELRGIVISHLHADHHFDVVPVYYGLKFGEARPSYLPGRVPLYVPPGGRDHLQRLGSTISSDPAFLDDLFQIEEYAPDRAYEIGGLTFSFHPVQHYILSHAMRIRAPSGRLLAFSSDVAPCPELVEAARDADLFLCESTILDRSEDDPDPLCRGHMIASEAGAAARGAGARRLVLTHYRAAGAADEARHLELAGGSYDGPVELAVEGRTYSV